MMGQVRYAVGYQRGCFRIRQLVPNIAGIKEGRGQEMDINYYRNLFREKQVVERISG